MAASDTEIANLALGHVGVSKSIGTLTTENSAEANACRRYYSTALTEVLRSYDWPFATRYLDLSLIESTPNSDWAYSYSYPTNCARVLKILSGTRYDSEDTRIEFEVANEADNDAVIFTDEDSPCVKYIHIITSEELYPHDFVMALSYILASYIFPMLMDADPFNFREKSIQLANLWIGRAASNAFNESKVDRRIDSLFVRGRN